MSLRPSHNKTAALTYADAVARIAGRNRKALAALDGALGGMLGIAAAAHPPIAFLIGAKNELVKASGEVLKKAAGDIRRAPVAERTELIAAAHVILIVTSFFEATGTIMKDRQIEPELAITRREQLLISSGGSLGGDDAGTESISPAAFSRLPVPLGSGLRSLSENLAELKEYYDNATEAYIRFISGLSAWEDLPPRQKESAMRALKEGASSVAIEIYETNFRQLATDIPEFYVWAQMRELGSIARGVAALTDTVQRAMADLFEPSTSVSLQGLAALLHELNAKNQSKVGSSLAEELAREYTSQVDRPLTEIGAMVGGTAVAAPTPAQAYIDPNFRYAVRVSPANASQHKWWQALPQRSDFRVLFASWLTSSESLTAPMLVLGNPGSGKSTLTRMLAAQLPPTAYLTIRVELRKIAADASVQSQIEDALEILNWNRRVSLKEAQEESQGLITVVFLDGLAWKRGSAACSAVIAAW